MKRRGRQTSALWFTIWSCALLLLGTESLDALQRSAPLPVWLVKLGPLAVLLPWLATDRLRAVIWVCLVSLLYFVIAVQRVFAEPDSLRALLGLLAVVGLFVSAMLYVRQRARELRAQAEEAHA